MRSFCDAGATLRHAARRPAHRSKGLFPRRPCLSSRPRPHCMRWHRCPRGRLASGWPAGAARRPTMRVQRMRAPSWCWMCSSMCPARAVHACSDAWWTRCAPLARCANACCATSLPRALVGAARLPCWPLGTRLAPPSTAMATSERALYVTGIGAPAHALTPRPVRPQWRKLCWQLVQQTLQRSCVQRAALAPCDGPRLAHPLLVRPCTVHCAQFPYFSVLLDHQDEFSDDQARRGRWWAVLTCPAHRLCCADTGQVTQAARGRAGRAG